MSSIPMRLSGLAISDQPTAVVVLGLVAVVITVPQRLLIRNWFARPAVRIFAAVTAFALV
jgi:hypothetical protein